MSLINEQIREKKSKGQLVGESLKWHKQQTHRKHRRKIKASLEYIPKYNRYTSGWVM